MYFFNLKNILKSNFSDKYKRKTKSQKMEFGDFDFDDDLFDDTAKKAEENLADQIKTYQAKIVNFEVTVQSCFAILILDQRPF